MSETLKPFAFCCAEAGGDPATCDCVNKNHGSALFKSVCAIPNCRFSHYAGRWFVAYHEGTTVSDYDLGWGLFPGFGGVVDANLEGWLPLPTLKGRTDD